MGAIEGERKRAFKKLQQNTTTIALSGNSMANGLVSSEKHIHSISLNIMLFICYQNGLMSRLLCICGSALRAWRNSYAVLLGEIAWRNSYAVLLGHICEATYARPHMRGHYCEAGLASAWIICLATIARPALAESAWPLLQGRNLLGHYCKAGICLATIARPA